MLMFFMDYLDRTSISIAAWAMNADLHLSAVDYGFAAGTFSLSYALFGLPSSMLLHRIGARVWLGAITIARTLPSRYPAGAALASGIALVNLAAGFRHAGLPWSPWPEPCRTRF